MSKLLVKYLDEINDESSISLTRHLLHEIIKLITTYTTVDFDEPFAKAVVSYTLNYNLLQLSKIFNYRIHFNHCPRACAEEYGRLPDDMLVLIMDCAIDATIYYGYHEDKRIKHRVVIGYVDGSFITLIKFDYDQLYQILMNLKVNKRLGDEFVWTQITIIYMLISRGKF